MEIQLPSDVQARLDQLLVETGRLQEDFVSHALAGYFEKLAQVRGLLDNRYNDLKSGRVALSLESK